MAKAKAEMDGGEVEAATLIVSDQNANFLREIVGPTISNFPPDPMKRMRLSLLAKGADTLDKDKASELTLQVLWVYVHPVQIAGNTPGEIIDAIRTVLITDKMEVISWCSSGVANSIATILECMGTAPWSKPLPLRIIKGKNRRGQPIYSLAIAD